MQVVINKELDFVVNELRSREASFKWIKGLKSFELIEGKLDEVNSKYLMVIENNGKSQEMVETITEFNPPRSITTVYEMGSVWNECVNRFESKEGKTVYSMDTTFKFGFVMKLFIWIFKPMFKKETLKGLLAFKEYCESVDN